MTLTISIDELISEFSGESVKLGDLKKKAKEIKKDHDLAMALWASEQVYPRMLAVLIMDKKLLTQEVIDQLVDDLAVHPMPDRLKIVDWLLANQLMKNKKTVTLLQSWENESDPLLRRLFWYHQARLRWTGQTPPDNTADLLSSLETDLATAEPEVQWAMNFTAGQIGVFQPEHRAQVIELGERVGLYKGDPVPRGCTPDYLPEFVRIEAAKRES